MTPRLPTTRRPRLGPLSPRAPLLAAALSLALTALVAPRSASAGDFTSAVSDARQTHYKFAPIAAQTLIMEDKLDEALQVFIKAVPDAQLTAADCTVLGELLCRLDDAQSLRYYRRASALLPDEPEAALALAQSLHRAGHHTEATTYYQRFLASETDPDSGRFTPHVLLAECLVRARQPQEALLHWEKARPEDNAFGIGRALFEVHGPASPLRRRADLLQAIAQGQTGKIEDLIALSAQWDQDWWSTQVNKAFLQRDLDLAKKHLARSEPQHLAELTLYARTYLEDLTPEQLKHELETHHWLIGEHATLPASARVAERLINLAVRHHLADSPGLLARFEKELRQRALAPRTHDLGAVNLLAGLMITSGKARSPELATLKRSGWQQHHDPLLAGAYLADKLNQNQLSTQDPELRRALTEFPQDTALCLFQVILAKEEKQPLREPLLAAIPAECTQLSPSAGPRRSTATLAYLFKLLQEDLSAHGGK